MEKLADPKDIAVFIEISRQSSLSRAAAVLELPNSHVSRRLQNLEATLGVKLVERSTRHFSLTELGKAYADLCTEGFEKLRAAQDYIESFKKEPQGLLKMLAPYEFGLYLCEHLLPEFTRAFPKIKVDLVLKNRPMPQDYFAVDVAIEVGRVMASQHFVQAKILTVHRKLFAAPAIGGQQKLKSLHDLPAAKIIALVGENGARSATGLTIRNSKSGELHELNSQYPIRVNSLTGAKKLALAGKGICFLPEFVVRAELRRKKLVPLFARWQSEPIDIYAVFAPGKRTNPKIDALVKFLKKNTVV